MKTITSAFIMMVLFSAFYRGECDIKCYSCSTYDSPECMHPANGAIELRKCDVEALKHMKKLVKSVEPELETTFEVLPPGNIPYTCMKQVIKVGSKEYVIRGCQLASANEKLDICSVLNKRRIKGMNVTHCSLCNWDACNNSKGHHYFSISSILIPFVMFVYYC